MREEIEWSIKSRVLERFLNAKPLYYDEIDYTRMPRVYQSIKERLKLPKIIHLIGTNGKGTTGRFLATALYNSGYKVGHYSSPHIMSFNERIWLNGKDIADEPLQRVHQELLTLLSQEDADALSYFEYTTLLAILIYKECDYVVLEAGLGGEHDATSVFENILTLVTPIGKDHEAFLGDTIEKIATTKLNAIQKDVIIAKQQSTEVLDIAKRITEEKGVTLFRWESLLKKDDYTKVQSIAQEQHLPLYLQENLQTAIAALNYLKIEYSCDSFKNARLFGRLSSLAENILIDVGHNVLAAEQIVKSLNEKKYVLVYNSYQDKNYREILTVLRPIIKRVEIIEVVDSRIESSARMQETLEDLGYTQHYFSGIEKDEEYLVFGSFSVIEAFLKVYHG